MYWCSRFGIAGGWTPRIKRHSGIAQVIRSLVFLLMLAWTPIVSAEEVKVARSAAVEASPYDASRTAAADVDTALVRAKAANKRVIVVMGANWCHDSRSLAGRFELPRFKAMMGPRYEIVYVDVGMKNRNIDIAQRYGIRKIKGTPTVLILSGDGKLLNKTDAPIWANAASRSDDAIFTYFDMKDAAHE
jgi:thiol-disulfide isomerase/thioredoxin